MTADDRLILIRVKIERAKKHLIDLETELICFGQQDFHAFTTDKNAQTGQSLEKFGKHRIRPFDALAAAGDVVHNLRSALDHLANQLVWVGSGKEPSRRIEFPIAQDATTYEREKARKVEGMRPETIEAIDALKPYKGGNDALWKIHELDNIDKHRSLFTYANDSFLVADWLRDVSLFPYNLKTNNPQFSGIYDSDVEKDLEFEIDEAVGNLQIPTGNALLPTLHQLVDFVDNLVVIFLPRLK
jgi:hypothetical protein